MMILNLHLLPVVRQRWTKNVTMSSAEAQDDVPPSEDHDLVYFPLKKTLVDNDILDIILIPLQLAPQAITATPSPSVSHTRRRDPAISSWSPPAFLTDTPSARPTSVGGSESEELKL